MQNSQLLAVFVRVIKLILDLPLNHLLRVSKVSPAVKERVFCVYVCVFFSLLIPGSSKTARIQSRHKYLIL